MDTDIFTALQQDNMKVVRKLWAYTDADVCLSIITVQEQFDGWLRVLNRTKTDADLARVYQNWASTVRNISGMPIITFTEQAILRYRTLLTMKLNIGKMDLRIAAIALEEDATVITRNLRDFERVPDLKCENWAD